ncbi:MAG TPA: alpha/beta hydrolase [Alphaproteobacteria bacterium]
MNGEMLRLPNGRSWQVFSGGAGPDLLWLHGLRGVDPADPMLAALQKRYRVVAPVAPGFNDLDELSKIDNIHELALDYDDLIEALKLRDFALVGHSFGAMIAAEIAAHFPRRPKRLILIAPFGLWNEAYPVADIFAIAYTQLDDILWHDAKARDAFAKPAAGEADAKAAADQMINLARSLTAVTKFVWPIPDRGLRRRLPRIVCPTLVLFGAEDAVIPARYAEDFRAGIRNVQTASVARAGHMLPYEQPQQVLELIGREPVAG